MFVLMETIIEIRKNQIFKKWPSFWKWKLGEMQFLKKIFFQLIKADLELSFY